VKEGEVAGWSFPGRTASIEKRGPFSKEKERPATKYSFPGGGTPDNPEEKIRQEKKPSRESDKRGGETRVDAVAVGQGISIRERNFGQEYFE